MEIMKKLMGFQSNVFIILTSLTLALGLAFDLDANLYGLMMVLVFVVLLGVPHGSLDVLFASQTYELKNMSHWLKFIAYYMAAALAVILVWWLVPNTFFIVFLILSALHFSDDLNLSDFAVLKLSYGTAIISFPSLLFSHELINLYAMIIQIDTATSIVKASQLISAPAGIIMAVYLLNQKIDVRTKLELLCTCALFLLLNPILAFGVYFCVMHSARHLIRSRFFLRSFTRQAFLNALIFPTIAVILMGLIIWWLGPKKPLEVDMIRIIFVGLAALTVPHAWVLKQSNFQAHSKRY
jgi:Brp/Blh family beta-carotene 15,15'-monooxygenase